MRQAGGFTNRPGGSSLVEDASRSGGSGTPGKRTLVEQLQRGDSGPGAPAAPVELPHRSEMERRFGADFGAVRGYVGQRELLAEHDARAAAEGEIVAFADASPDREVVAHELTHVLQQRRAGGAVGAASRAVAPEHDAAELEADANAERVGADAGTRTLEAVQAPTASLHLDRNKPKPVNAPVPQTGGLGDWVGAGKAGKIFQNATTETFVDGGVKDSLEIRTHWTLAEFESYELETDAVMEAERTIHIQLARGSSILIRSRARSWFHADQLPNDVHAALHAPAKLIQHDGSIVVTDDKGLHILRTYPHPLGKAQSTESMLAGEPMLGFATPPEQRLREANQFAADTVPAYDANMLLIEGIMQDAPRAALGLRDYIKAKLGYESPSPDALAVARHTISRIETVVSHAATGYEGTDLLMHLGAMRRHLEKLLRSAEHAKPADKDVWDHALDAVKAIGKAAVGLGIAVKEIGLMARDLGMRGLDELANAFGYDIDWTAASSIGKAYQAGKSTGEIFTAIVGGIIDQWNKAIEHAGNGDFSLLMDLGAELALDLAIEVASIGAATPAVAAKHVGTGARAGARALELTQNAAEALARRAEDVIAKIRAALARAPAEARKALLDSLDVATGLSDGLRHALKHADTGGGPKVAVLDPGAIPRAIQRARGARAIGDARMAMGKLRGPAARKQGHGVVDALEQLAKTSGMSNAVHAIARKLADGDDKAKLAARLDDALGTWGKKLDDEVLASVLRRAADAGDPVLFLDNVDWVMGKRMKLEARQQLVRQAVGRTAPLDLRWLRTLTDLPDKMLEFMALDPSTHWKTFMKVSDKPSDYFPSSLKKQLAKTDYAEAGAKLRGVAGELIFVVDNIELPGGLQIVGRQVDAGPKKIDFQLENAAGKKAKLEVKAWNEKRWPEGACCELRQAQPPGPDEADGRAAPGREADRRRRVPRSVGCDRRREGRAQGDPRAAWSSRCRRDHVPRGQAQGRIGEAAKGPRDGGRRLRARDGGRPRGVRR
jgi:hypothetical protein